MSTNYEPEFGGPIIKAFQKGNIVLFLGAGINLCDSPPQVNLIHLASSLYKTYNTNKAVWGIPCAVCDLSLDELCQISETCPLWQKAPKETWREEILEQKLILAKSHLRLLSQYVKLLYKNKPKDLYDELHRIWDEEYKRQLTDPSRPRRLHEFLATLPKQKRKRYQKGEGWEKLPYKLIVTTNFDETLEQAFEEAKQPYDVVSYIADGEDRGSFKHECRDENGKTQHIGLILNGGVTESYEKYDKLRLEEVPTILKLFGTWDSEFVITEEHHITYCPQGLNESSVHSALMSPITKNKENVRLFLGYSLYDSDLLTILYKIWNLHPPNDKESYIVHQSIPGHLENKFRDYRNLDEYKMSLGDFITNLKMGIEEAWK